MDSRWRLALAFGALLVLFPLWVMGARALPGWGFDFTTPPTAAMAAIFGVLSAFLPGRARLILSLPATGLATCCLWWTRQRAMSLTLPCDWNTLLCREELSKSVGLSAQNYGLLLGVATFPVLVALLAGLSQKSWGRAIFLAETGVLGVAMGLYGEVAMGWAG